MLYHSKEFNTLTFWSKLLSLFIKNLGTLTQEMFVKCFNPLHVSFDHLSLNTSYTATTLESLKTRTLLPPETTPEGIEKYLSRGMNRRFRGLFNKTNFLLSESKNSQLVKLLSSFVEPPITNSLFLTATDLW